MYIRERVLNKIRYKLCEAIKKAFGEVEIPEFSIEAPKDRRYGDFSTNVAMLLSRTLSGTPYEIALVIAENFDKAPLVTSVKAADGGFINLFLCGDYIYEVLLDIERLGENYGRAFTPCKKHIFIETGEQNYDCFVHIGEIRRKVIAETLKEIFIMAGYDTELLRSGEDHEIRTFDSDKKCNIIKVGHTRLIINGESIKNILPSELFNADYGDAVRFLFNMRSADARFDLELDSVLKMSKENPFFYVQYTHARICSIKRRAALDGVFVKPYKELDIKRLTSESELCIMRRLADFPEVIRISAATCDTSKVAQYLVSVASLFNGFYNEHTIKDLHALQARFKLADSVRIVLACGLYILGVAAPEKI